VIPSRFEKMTPDPERTPWMAFTRLVREPAGEEGGGRLDCPRSRGGDGCTGGDDDDNDDDGNGTVSIPIRIRKSIRPVWRAAEVYPRLTGPGS